MRELPVRRPDGVNLGALIGTIDIVPGSFNP